MVSSTFCQLCGQKVAGRSKTFRHKRWPRGVSLRVCPDCQRSKPRCRLCGLPVVVASGDGLCATCRTSARTCLTCGKPITDKYYEFDGVGPYCKTCTQDRDPCDVCGAPLADEHWQLSDGRMICAHCHLTAVYSPGDAQALYEQMKEVVSRRLSLKLNVPTGLALVDRNQLKKVIRKQQDNGANGTNNPEDLDPEHTLGIYARRGMRRGIYVQSGLPRMLFLQVAAHEFAHAWQGENCPVLRDGQLHEGFAEWIAFHVLGYYGYRQGQERMIARSDIYGEGLRWALDTETKHGVGSVIDACRGSK